jgi:hypothetical protein
MKVADGPRENSFLGNFDGNFRAIGLCEPGLVFQAGWHRAVADFVGVAIFVKLEQFGRERFAAGVTLTLVLVDVDLQLSCHGTVSPQNRTIKSLWFVPGAFAVVGAIVVARLSAAP